MIDIEELSRQILSSWQFKEVIKEQVLKCMKEGEVQERDESVQMEVLVKQIGDHMASITQLALEEENGHRYMGLVKRNEEMYGQLERRMQLQMEARVQSLRDEIMGLRNQVKQTYKQLQRKGKESEKLRSQRKTVTKSIIDTSRFLANSKTKSTLDPRGMSDRLQTTSELGQSQLRCSNDSNSQEFQRSYLTSSDKENAFYGLSGTNEAEQIKKQQVKVKNELSSLSERLESKMQANLQGVWNVLSDLNTRMAKIQTFSSLLDLNPV